MKLGIAAVAVALSTLSLAGCAGEPVEPPPARSAPVRDDTHLFESKQVVEGTELICLRDDSYGSTTCNWELWNKTREGTK